LRDFTHENRGFKNRLKNPKKTQKVVTSCHKSGMTGPEPVALTTAIAARKGRLRPPTSTRQHIAAVRMSPVRRMPSTGPARSSGSPTMTETGTTPGGC